MSILLRPVLLDPVSPNLVIYVHMTGRWTVQDVQVLLLQLDDLARTTHSRIDLIFIRQHSSFSLAYGRDLTALLRRHPLPNLPDDTIAVFVTSRAYFAIVQGMMRVLDLPLQRLYRAHSVHQAEQIIRSAWVGRGQWSEVDAAVN